MTFLKLSWHWKEKCKQLELWGETFCSKCFPFANVWNSQYFIIKLNLNILLFMTVIWILEKDKKWKAKILETRRGILMFNLDLTCRGGLIRPGRLFSNLSSKIIVVQTWFCYWCKHLSSGNLSDILNMSVKSTKKFPATFEKKFQLKTGGFVRIFQPHFELHFFKISIFSHFLNYSLIDASCGYDFFYWRKHQS